MKKLILFCLLISGSAICAPPEIIQPKTRIIRPIGWYSEQATLWKDYLKDHPTEASSWLQYYNALRYSQATQGELAQALTMMRQQIPGTFQIKVAEALNAGISDGAVELMKAAYRMNPGDGSTYASLLSFSELTSDLQDRAMFSKKLLAAGQVSQALLNYSYNVLMSLDENAVLITEGENMTLPLFILQDEMGMRNDVIVLSLDLLMHDPYRTRKFAEEKLSFSGKEKSNSDEGLKKLFCTLLPEENPRRKFFYALSLNKENISSIKENLYVTGLASQISKERIDNLEIIKQNLENRFLTDYLRVDFNGESEFSAGKIMGSNYLIPMLMLDGYYVKSGEIAKSNELRKIVMNLVKESGKRQLVLNFLNAGDHVPYINSVVNAATVEGGMKQIKANIYAEFHEVTNEEYNGFLAYLEQNKLSELYEKYKFDLSAYTEPALSMMKSYSTPIKPVKKNKFYTNYPAVNMSYEGAVAYCQWLTDQYNHQPEKKFKEVRFRLPNINEWQIAALGFKEFTSWSLDDNTVMAPEPLGDGTELGNTKKKIPVSAKDISYPWWSAHDYRNKSQNHRHCWLANFKVPDNSVPCDFPKMAGDGYATMSPVAVYFVNGMGLYDMVGNVSEMSSEKGKACGGSWNNLPEESTIRSVNDYSGPSASIGFRVFMEVIQK